MASLQHARSASSGRLQKLLSTLPQLSNKGLPRPCQTFTLFPKLSTELRVKIWSEASSVPRTLTILETCTIKTPNMPNEVQVPAVLPVCAESRMEALKHYSLCFQKDELDCLNPQSVQLWKCTFDRKRLRHRKIDGKLVYVNFSVDHFMQSTMRPTYVLIEADKIWTYNFSPSDCRKIQHVDLWYDIHHTDPPGYTWVQLLKVVADTADLTITLYSGEDSPNFRGACFCNKENLTSHLTMKIFEEQIREKIQSYGEHNLVKKNLKLSFRHRMQDVNDLPPCLMIDGKARFLKLVR